MKRVKISDGTHWPNPKDYRDITWKMIHAPDSLSGKELMSAASVMQAYSELILHPAFTLRVVQKKVSGIRKAIRKS